MNIPRGIHILTESDLETIKDNAFQRGVERGRFEERIDRGKEKVAKNCANWKDGQCQKCGVPQQYFEVSGSYKCPYFTKSEDQS